MSLEAAWERIKGQVYRQAFESWKQTMLSLGYADHAWVSQPTFTDMENAAPNALELWMPCCSLRESMHHPNMVAWEQLTEKQQSQYLLAPQAVFKLVWEQEVVPRQQDLEWLGVTDKYD